MSNLEKAVVKLQWQDVSIQREEDEIVGKIFKAQRNSLIAFYCQAMRTGARIESQSREIETWNQSVPARFARPIPEDLGLSRRWFSAAILILTHTDEAVQKQFLTLSDSRRGKLVQAVLDDDGIWQNGNHWQEIPE